MAQWAEALTALRYQLTLAKILHQPKEEQLQIMLKIGWILSKKKDLDANATALQLFQKIKRIALKSSADRELAIALGILHI